jgi:putative NADPH-quinone reductase/1,4-dihydroxy-2-naphthoate octaprenyltransferase
MNVLVIIGHPRKESYTSALAGSYMNGAGEAGATVRSIHVADLVFNPNVIYPTTRLQEDEPDILMAKESISWANHIAFIYPTWWGTMPALLKAFVDRVFTSGYAFRETEGGTGYEPMLGGKTAEIITTMDTPPIIYRLIYRSPGHHALGQATLEFCGFRITGKQSFGPVKKSDVTKRKQWLQKAHHRGKLLERGALSGRQKLWAAAGTWLKAIRLQFYPMSFIAYSAGALAAVFAGHTMDLWIFWLGYAWLFLLELTTVLSNEYFDYHSDRNNEFYGPFNGGSRVMVNRQISFAKMKKAIIITGMAGISVLMTLFILFKIPFQSAGWFSIIVFFLALGYTVPPMKLSYRGMGELTVGLTHSFAVIMSGYLFMGGSIADPLPLLLGLPLFFSVLPSILLAGIPDHDADRAAGKGTLAVRVGPKNVARLGIIFTIVSLGIIIIYESTGRIAGVFNGILYGVVPHAILLVYLLHRYIKNYSKPGRIDLLLVAALTYLMWYAIVPTINLL